MSETHTSLTEFKIWKPEDLQIQLQRWRLLDERVVFTNGVFDILHRGHVKLLEEASSHGTKLLVGINSDASARSLNKGPERPINKETDRAYVIAGLASVAAVIVFDEETPAEILKMVEPHVLVKGGDYDAMEADATSKKFIVGSKEQAARGSQTLVIPFVDGFSTTAIVQKIANG